MTRSLLSYLVILTALAEMAACKDEKPAPVSVSGDASQAEQPSESPTISRLTWPGRFEDWYGQELLDGARVPECPGGWYDRPLDDEIALWKCPSYPDLRIHDRGQLTVHARNDKVFLVTVSADFDDTVALDETLQTLETRNAGREVTLSKKHRKLFRKLWSFEGHAIALSAGSSGLSMLYLRSSKDLDEVAALLDRQGKYARTGKGYRLSGIEYTVKAFNTQDYVGRGRERWDAKKDTDFIIIDYQVRNFTKTVHQDDPATFTLIGRDMRLTPDERAERAHLRSDRTGHFVMPLKYRARRQRAHVFEVNKRITADPMLLIINNDGEKVVFELDFAAR